VSDPASPFGPVAELRPSAGSRSKHRRSVDAAQAGERLAHAQIQPEAPRQLERIETLPKTQQTAVLKTIDNALELHSLKTGTR
jgi:hypothetical protein